MKTILIIEDEQSILENTVDFLSMENFNPIPAENGFIGLELAKKHLPDVILCDIRMPEMDGYQLLEKLKDNPVTKNIPFIFMSSHANPDDIERVRAMGIDYMVKPFHIGDLMEVINKSIN